MNCACAICTRFVSNWLLMSCGHWAQGHLRTTEGRSLWQHVADNAPFWTRSNSTFKFNINSALDQPLIGLLIFFPFWIPLSAESPINVYQQIPEPSKTLAQKNTFFSPSVPGLERDTLVSFPKLSETAWTADEAVNRGAMKFPNFQRPWLTYSRQCTVLNQVQECLRI